jgi:hypothetical protein
MLKTRLVNIHIRPIENNRYFIWATNDHNEDVQPSQWKTLLFNRHKESYYGTFVDEETIDLHPGVSIDAWQLVSLLAQEQFNQLIEWDWDETRSDF